MQSTQDPSDVAYVYGANVLSELPATISFAFTKLLLPVVADPHKVVAVPVAAAVLASGKRMLLGAPGIC